MRSTNPRERHNALYSTSEKWNHYRSMMQNEERLAKERKERYKVCHCDPQNNSNKIIYPGESSGSQWTKMKSSAIQRSEIRPRHNSAPSPFVHQVATLPSDMHPHVRNLSQISSRTAPQSSMAPISSNLMIQINKASGSPLSGSVRLTSKPAASHRVELPSGSPPAGTHPAGSPSAGSPLASKPPAGSAPWWSYWFRTARKDAEQMESLKDWATDNVESKKQIWITACKQYDQEVAEATQKKLKTRQEWDEAQRQAQVIRKIHVESIKWLKLALSHADNTDGVQSEMLPE